MAPLNIAWLLQAWTVLGLTAFALGPANLWAVQLPVLAWIIAATATAQVVAWTVEWVRRGRRGPWIVRALVTTLIVVGAVLVVTEKVGELLNSSPTVDLAIAAAQGSSGQWQPWLSQLAQVLVLGMAALVVGAWPAHLASRRLPHDETRLESGYRTPGPTPRSDLAALLRTDRTAIWRSVPLRRGVTVLGVTPGLVALAGGIGWDILPIMPGLVASGGALLFGVNAWCLDGRGALWRDSLPVAPRLVFVARALVLLEVLVAAVLVTVVLGVLRAGPATAAEVTALLVAAVVLPVQVVATSLTWAVRRPYAVDMRSARATPAPPVVMVGYSSRLALTTTLTGMLIGGVAVIGHPLLPVMFGLPFLLLSARRLVRAAELWSVPEERSRVVATVAS